MNKLIIYPEFPKQINRDGMYSVTVVQGEDRHELPVYNHTVKGTTSENDIFVDNFRRFCTFGFSGEGVRVDIKVNRSFSCYSVMPSAKNFKHEFDPREGVISVLLDKPDYFLVRLDESDDTILSVLSDGPEDYEFNEEKTIRVEGWYEPEDGSGRLTVTKPDTTIYIAPGAVLNARIDILADNVRVIGRGAMLDPYANIFKYDQNKAGDNWFLHTRKNNVTVDGIHLIDARCFQIGFNGNGNVAKNVKILSAMMCSDGITFSAGEDNIAEHCFIYNSDNCMVFSASGTTYRDMTVGTTCCAIYAQGSPENVRFEDIHIFRADSKDSGLIRNIYNPTKTEQHMSIKVKNLDTVDCTIQSSIFFAHGIGRLYKCFDLEGLSLKISNTDKPMFTVVNNDKFIFTDNYDFKLKNIAVNGKAWTSNSDISVDLQNCTETAYTYSRDGSFVPVEHMSSIADYILPSAPVKKEKAQKNENLLSDKGEIISEYANLPSWCLYVSAVRNKDSTVYKATNFSHAAYSSIVRMLNEEISKNGVGKYALCFEARANRCGKLKAVVRMKSATCEAVGIYEVTDEWTACRLEFEVLDCNDSTACLRIMSHEKALEEFEICNIALYKL